MSGGRGGRGAIDRQANVFCTDCITALSFVLLCCEGGGLGCLINVCLGRWTFLFSSPDACSGSATEKAAIVTQAAIIVNIMEAQDAEEEMERFHFQRDAD